MRRRAPAVGAAVLALVALVAPGCAGSRQEATDRATTTGPDTTTTRPAREDADDLGDGTHDVRVASVDLLAGVAVLDGVQVLSGMDAVLAYLADTDGAQLEGPQVYVRNAFEEPRELPVDAAGSFSVIAADACCEVADVGWSAFAEVAAGDFESLWGSDPPFTATISDGVVRSLEQIYIP